MQTLVLVTVILITAILSLLGVASYGYDNSLAVQIAQVTLSLEIVLVSIFSTLHLK